MVATTLTMTLEEFMANPRDRTEWVDGRLLEKDDMNAKTGRIQARLARLWGNYMESGEVYTETPCRTTGRTRCPDVAYLTPELVAEHGDFKILPQSFPLVAEVISPTDELEDVFGKVGEYLATECQEVWLVMPESQMVLVVTAQAQQLYRINDTVQTQQVLPGFAVAAAALLA
jgi:Uma2 family endonuclease